MSEPNWHELADGVVSGDRRAMAKAITLVESTRPDHRDEAERLLEHLLPASGSALRLGVTGTPGVGKSTFINQLGMNLVAKGHKVAVLAVDPSSRTTGGSILGDKTRMAELSTQERAYIRPSPSGGIDGGVAIRTSDAMVVCEAAGFDIVVVETVGVGQSETAVAGLTDLFLLLVAPGGGDDLQGIKRGVMELADVVAVNKADGALAQLADQTAADYQAALHLVRPKRPDFETAVLTCSSLTAVGLDEVWETLVAMHARLASSDQLSRLRSSQAVTRLQSEIRLLLYRRAGEDPGFVQLHNELSNEVAAGSRTVSSAANRLTDRFFGSPGQS